MTQPRSPKGIPAGGQYAAATHQEAASSLTGQPNLARRLIDEYPELGEVAQAVSATGTPCYIVGGTMRDLASGDTPTDLDITSRLRPEQFRAAVAEADGSVYDIGEEHGTTGIRFLRDDGTEVVIEHTTHRTDGYEPGSRTPTVEMGTSLEADLARRDFTINAVAMDLNTGEIVDPYGGMTDLDAGVLRTPGDPERTFNEDPLRIARLVRFAATRDLQIDPASGVAAEKVSDRMKIVSAERKRGELAKIFKAGPEATASALACSDALGSGVREQVWCGLGDQATPADLQGIHHTNLTRQADVIAALAFHSSDPAGALRGLKFTNDETAGALATVKAAQELDTYTDPPTFRKALRRHGHETITRANRITASNHPALHTAVAHRLANDEGFDTRPLPVDGNDAIQAGLKGRAIGSALRAVEDAMCSDPDLTRDDALTILSNGQ